MVTSTPCSPRSFMRRATWKQPKPRYTSGVLAKYMRLVNTASKGAVTDA